jgi:flavin-dependent dehydrogenase
VAVLGAGPGGALAASICAARGLDIVVLEHGELRGTHLPESWVGGAEAYWMACRPSTATASVAGATRCAARPP